MRTLRIGETTGAVAISSAEDFSEQWIRKGSRDYGRASLALFLAGFSSFSLIYCVQPLLPEFKNAFGLSPATASLALSLTTGTLALAILASGAFSQLFSRRRLMFASMALAALCNLAAAVAPGWYWLLAARTLEGLVLGGVPAIAMAYLAEEIEPAHLGRAMGLYVGGTAFGAMMGRVGIGVITEFASWRIALAVMGLTGIASAIGFLCLLPASRNFTVTRGTPFIRHIETWTSHLRKPVLARLFFIGFLLTSIFVTVFNYTTFRLVGEPYGLGQTAISMIFLTFAFGIVSSSVGGALADRFGRRTMLLTGFLTVLFGVVLTLFDAMPLIIAGIALITTGFFIGHSAASGAIGANAGSAKSHASSLYLLFYYMGSSITGSIGGWFWQHGGWPWVAALAGLCALTGAAIALTIPARKGQQA
ncbi:MFS transporter (plasmid) [Rhizobium sp. ACO-34A]|nr:MFS transporter [Rhizobium sp. ACO-34A]ATN37605.1 MFS transporter [Rhizobium sp. ACO-34A]